MGFLGPVILEGGQCCVLGAILESTGFGCLLLSMMLLLSMSILDVTAIFGSEMLLSTVEYDLTVSHGSAFLACPVIFHM